MGSEDSFWNAAFELTYQPHGGSGVHLGLDAVLDMPLDRIEWFLERIEARRDAEAKAIRESSKK